MAFIKTLSYRHLVRKFTSSGVLLGAGFFAAQVMFAGQILSAPEATAAVNPKLVYLLNGQPTKGWTLMVGNPNNWGIPLSGQSGETEGKNLKVSPTQNLGKNDALLLHWNGKKVPRKNPGAAQFSVVGQEVNLSAFKDQLALAIDIRLEKKLHSAVTVYMDCTYPCRGNFPLRPILKQQPVKKWVTIPIPLNCFKPEKDTFDLAKINSPFGIKSEGKVKLSLGSVRLIKLGKDDKGCAAEE